MGYFPSEHHESRPETAVSGPLRASSPSLRGTSSSSERIYSALTGCLGAAGRGCRHYNGKQIGGMEGGLTEGWRGFSLIDGLADRRRLPPVRCSAGGSSSIIRADAAHDPPSRHRGKP